MKFKVCRTVLFVKLAVAIIRLFFDFFVFGVNDYEGRAFPFGQLSFFVEVLNYDFVFLKIVSLNKTTTKNRCFL